METKRLIAFIVIAVGIMVGWNYMFPQPVPVTQTEQTTQQTPSDQPPSKINDNVQSATEAPLPKSKQVKIKTDVLEATIDTTGADLRGLSFFKHDATADATKRFTLLSDQKDRIYVAQTGLMPVPGKTEAENIVLPSPKTVFSTDKSEYTLTGNTLEVKFTAPESQGVQVEKVYTFTKGSYEIGIKYIITNKSGVTITPTAYYRLLRDNHTPEGESRFAYTYTGPAIYTPEEKFQKIPFGDLDKEAEKNNKFGIQMSTPTGWVSFIQHYFVSAWILQPKNQASVCGKSNCEIQVNKRSDGLYSAGVVVKSTPIANDKTGSMNMMLYAGPEEFKTITQVADNLERTKDYGKVHIFSSPLFWLLSKLHDIVQNWGWAIVLLTILVKVALYPLTAASYRSMAKMRAVAPRLQTLKEQFGDDRAKLQQAMMEMYKKEKINPLGGCLPMLLQIPIFIGLYWALLASVELRQAPWILWIHDLARPDPYYILPSVMAITMYVQTLLNPPPPDPMQAKMMKIMPIAFSVMFFFFPAGLVLYWLVNNILSIGQQWLVNKSIQKRAQKDKA